jgi:hypothetical protein
VPVVLLRDKRVLAPNGQRQLKAAADLFRSSLIPGIVAAVSIRREDRKWARNDLDIQVPVRRAKVGNRVALSHNHELGADIDWNSF